MRNRIKTALLMGLLTAVVMGVGLAVAPGHLALFAVLAVVLNLGGYFFADRLVLRMHRATELGPADEPELHAMVAELARRAEIPMPRLFFIDDEQPNAFATGRNPAHGVVAVTAGLLDLLSPRELRAVIAHELAHIKNRDILVSTLAAMGAAITTYAVHSSVWSGLFGGGSSDSDEDAPSILGSLVLLVTAPLAATLVQLGISRTREHLADETGARISGDPEALASALAKLERGAHVLPSTTAQPATASLFIVNPFAATGVGLSRWLSTHPATEERIARLLAMVPARAPGRTPIRRPTWARVVVWD